MIVTDKNIIKYRNGETEHLDDSVICEQWFNLYLNEQLIYQTPVLDQDIDDLIYGQLFLHGHSDKGDILDITKKDRSWYVTSKITEKRQPLRKMVESALEAADSGAPPLVPAGKAQYKAEKILDLMKELQSIPSAYHKTGGVHMAAFATDRIVHWADDISRRNSVDKVIGKVFRSGMDFKDGIIVSSGRISSDIAFRLVKTGIPLIASISAPMDKGICLAEHYGITLCGFVRGRRMNIYTNTWRVSTD